MPSLPLSIIDTPSRTHRRLFTELSPGHLELCLDNSTLEKMLGCARAFEIYAVLGRDVGERDALNYGSCMHGALEIYYLRMSDPENYSWRETILNDMIKFVVEHFSNNPCSDNSWRNADHAIEACKRYVNWRRQMPHWEVAVIASGLAVEIPFKLNLFEWTDEHEVEGAFIKYPMSLVVDKGDQYESGMIKSISVKWTGKIDLIRKTTDGKLRPVDHKTTSIGGQTFWSSFDLSSQMMGYTWATQQITGQEIEGVDIDCLIGRAPTTKGAGITHDNEWAPYNYTQDQLAEWKLDMETHIRRIIDYLLTGYFPKSTTHCANKYGMCPYHDVCKQPSKDTATRILMSGQYAEKKWNPLEKLHQ